MGLPESQPVNKRRRSHGQRLPVSVHIWGLAGVEGDRRRRRTGHGGPLKSPRANGSLASTGNRTRVSHRLGGGCDSPRPPPRPRQKASFATHPFRTKKCLDDLKIPPLQTFCIGFTTISGRDSRGWRAGMPRRGDAAWLSGAVRLLQQASDKIFRREPSLARSRRSSRRRAAHSLLDHAAGGWAGQRYCRRGGSAVRPFNRRVAALFLTDWRRAETGRAFPASLKRGGAGACQGS